MRKGQNTRDTFSQTLSQKNGESFSKGCMHIENASDCECSAGLKSTVKTGGGEVAPWVRVCSRVSVARDGTNRVAASREQLRLAASNTHARTHTYAHVRL